MEAPFSNKNQKHLKAVGFSDHFLSFLLRLLPQILSKSTIITLSKLKIIYLILLGELWVFIRLFQPAELPGLGFGEEFEIVPFFSPGNHREMWLHPSPSISQPKSFIAVEDPTWSQENTGKQGKTSSSISRALVLFHCGVFYLLPIECPAAPIIPKCPAGDEPDLDGNSQTCHTLPVQGGALWALQRVEE